MFACLDSEIGEKPQSEEKFEKSDTFLELEESENPLPPLYELKHLTDNSKWMMLNDLSNLLNIKSKDKLLKHVTIQFALVIPFISFFFTAVSIDPFNNHSEGFNN